MSVSHGDDDLASGLVSEHVVSLRGVVVVDGHFVVVGLVARYHALELHFGAPGWRWSRFALNGDGRERWSRPIPGCR